MNRNTPAQTTTMKSTHWDVQYAKFILFPHSPPSSSLLRPLPSSKTRRLKGTWVPSRSSHVSLQLSFNDHDPFPQPTLVLSIDDTIFEEHYISKLNFTWPQLSCLSKCSIKGSRVMFASYREYKGQIHKFAMRFSSSAECHGFMESLKCLKEGRVVDRSITMPSSVLFQGTGGDRALVWQRSMNQEHVPYSCSQQAVISHALEDRNVELPQSFTALLADCCTDTDPGVPQAPAELNLKDFLKAGRVADKSFIDLLEKMDNIIVGLGGGLAF